MADENDEQGGDDKRQEDSREDRRVSPVKIARRACRQFAELSGREIETVVSLAKADDGWSIGIEVLEIARIPDTADVLAEYEVTTDRRGRVTGYERRRRYTRGATREDR